MLLPLAEPPYYALKLECNRLSTLCGVMIDSDCKVLDENGEWIEGLFAGGLDSAGFFMQTTTTRFLDRAARSPSSPASMPPTWRPPT